jgi:endonuclease/exonuclease/phosphatase family metal-dependent hydrolase
MDDNHNAQPASPASPASPSMKRWRLLLRAGAQGMLAIIGAYGMSTLGLLLLYQVWGESVPVIAMFYSFAHLLWLGVLPLLLFGLLIALVMRKPLAWLATLLLLPALFALVAHYAPQFMPNDTNVHADGSTLILNVYTHNIAPRGADYDGIDALIAQADADIVALQEIGDETEAHLSQRWRETYPHMAIFAGEMSAHQGQAILSRYPILEADYWQNDYFPFMLGHMRVVLRIGARDIVVYNVHPVHPGINARLYDSTSRGREIQDILARAQAETLPVILLGDFNTHDTSQHYDWVAQEYTDVYRAVGWGMGWTFPAYSDTPAPTLTNRVTLPLLRLDYIFVDEHFVPIDAEVVYPAGRSDHHPLQAKIGLLRE